MKIDEKNIIGKIEDSLRACLQRVPFLEIDSLERGLNLGDAPMDIVADVRVAKQRQRLAIEALAGPQQGCFAQAQEHNANVSHSKACAIASSSVTGS